MSSAMCGVVPSFLSGIPRRYRLRDRVGRCRRIDRARCDRSGLTTANPRSLDSCFATPGGRQPIPWAPGQGYFGDLNLVCRSLGYVVTYRPVWRASSGQNWPFVRRLDLGCHGRVRLRVLGWKRNDLESHLHGAHSLTGATRWSHHRKIRPFQRFFAGFGLPAGEARKAPNRPE
jgi:hypothetical protein